MVGQRDKCMIDYYGTAVGVVDMQACLAVVDTTQSLDLLATATGYAQRALVSASAHVRCRLELRSRLLFSRRISLIATVLFSAFTLRG